MVLNVQQTTIRQYLLGELSEKEQETLELWLMCEEDAYDQLAAAEDDLIDESISGKLNRHELERLNNHFLNAPARKRKLWFGQNFRQFVDRIPAAEPVRTIATHPTSRFWDLFRPRPLFAYATAALLLLVIGGGAWTGFQLQDMQDQLATATQQLDASRASTEQLQATLGTFERAVANVKSSAPQAFLGAVLTATVVRSNAESPVINLKSNAQFVELSIPILDADYDAYHAILVDKFEKEISKRDGPATMTGEVKSVVLVVPADLFKPGDYNVRLSGRSASKPLEKINSYPFHVTR